MGTNKLKNMLKWEKYYKLAENHYNYYGHLNIRRDFKTMNGTDYDKDGVFLSPWLEAQRRAYRGTSNSKLTTYQIQKLEEIRMEWKPFESSWEKYYKLAESYYNYYGHLNIRRDFKTVNGYQEDENGVLLGKWINNQRIAYHEIGGNKITEEQIQKLNKIEMIWNLREYNFIYRTITRKNKIDTKKKLLEKLKKFLEEFDVTEINSKEDINRINKQFNKSINSSKRLVKKN